MAEERLDEFLPELPRDDDADAMRRLARDGSDLGKPMSVDFFVSVPDEKSGNAIAEAARRAGFRVAVERDGESTTWTCYCAREMVVTYDAVREAQQTLANLSRPHGGTTDGWGSFGNG